MPTTPQQQETPNDVSFVGQWSTQFGLLTLQQEGDAVAGTYELGTVTGILKDRELTLRYEEPNATGEARFTLSADGSTFKGTWRQDGTTQWLPWNGKRQVVKPRGFDGLWNTSFGLMRLTADGDNVPGAYDYVTGPASIEGEVRNKRLTFRYREPERQGSAWFQLSNNDLTIQGKWREDGSASPGEVAKCSGCAACAVAKTPRTESRGHEKP